MATPGQSLMADALPRAVTSSSGNVPSTRGWGHLLAVTVRTLCGSFGRRGGAGRRAHHRRSVLPWGAAAPDPQAADGVFGRASRLLRALALTVPEWWSQNRFTMLRVLGGDTSCDARRFLPMSSLLLPEMLGVAWQDCQPRPSTGYVGFRVAADHAATTTAEPMLGRLLRAAAWACEPVRL